MATRISSIFLIFIIIYRIGRDTVDFIIKNIIPWIVTIVGSTPLNIIFLIGIAILVVLYIFSEAFAWVEMLRWEFVRLGVNIQLIPMNLIIQLFYSWWAQIWNDGAEFWVLLIEMIWNGICGGAEGFQEIVDCTGFDNFLIMFELIVSLLYSTFLILMFVLQLIFQSLQDSMCIDIECSNICETPACNTWIERRIDPFSGVIIENPGPFRIDKSYLSEVDVYMAQILSKIIISGIQYFIEDILPAIVIGVAFGGDLMKCNLLFFAFIAEWAIKAFAELFTNASYIIIRAFRSVLNSEEEFDLTIIWDPGYYNNITLKKYSVKHEQEVRDQFIDDYMSDPSELLLMNPKLPGDPDIINFLIDVVLLYKGTLSLLFEIPILGMQLSDKIFCFIINLPFCLPLNFLVCGLVKPPVDCVVYQLMTNIGAGNYEYDPRDVQIKDLYSLIRNVLFSNPNDADDCKSTSGIVYKDTDKHWLDGRDTGAPDFHKNWRNLTCIKGIEYPYNHGTDFGPLVCGITNIVCSTINDCPSSCSGCVNFFGNFRCLCSGECTHPETGASGSCQFCATSTLDLRPYGDENDVWQLVITKRYCGHVFHMENGGPLFFRRDTVFGDIIDPFINFVSGFIEIFNDIPAVPNIPDPFINFWGLMAEISTWFWDECNSLLPQGQCPCTPCEVDPSQPLYFLDFIPGIKGFPCNPNHPDPAKKCCIVSPYFSILWVFDDIYEAVGLDLFDQSEIVLP